MIVQGVLLLVGASREVVTPPIYPLSRSSLPYPASGTEILISTTDGEGNGRMGDGGDSRDHWQGGGGLVRGRRFTSVDFSFQSGGLREMEEARTSMITLDWDVDSHQALRRCPSFYRSFAGSSLSLWGILSKNDSSIVGGVGDSGGPFQ